MIRRCVPVLAVIVSAACGDGPTTTSSGALDLSREWTTGSLETVGADRQRIENALDAARSNRRLLSVLAVKDGRLVVEEYFRGNRRDSVNDVRSVTKSVVSILTGIALDRGFIRSLDQSIADFLEPDVAILPAGHRAITVRHLLTMTGGFEWDESGGFGSYNDWILSNDHIAYVLSRPLGDPPGASFTYNSAAVHLLGVVVEQATDLPLPVFANRFLFGPMGIEDARWEQLPLGYVNGGAGLDLRPRDLARLGQLYIQGGRSGDEQVIPASWITTSSQPQFTWRFTAESVLPGVTYGYLWWVVTSEPEPAFFAWGYGGQFIYVVPSLDLVVVLTTEWRGVSQDGGADAFERAGLHLITRELVPGFRGPR